MLLLGLDIGTSSIKVSVIDAETQQVIASTQYPDVEVEISSPQEGWAEQAPEMWWTNVQEAIKCINSSKKFNPKDIGAIGIAYQMHGLVMLDKMGKVLRPSIIWCDSRAVKIGEKAFETLGEKHALSHLLNSPGNFTASKLAWVKENEPAIYAQCDKIMLPGDYISYCLTGEITTSNSGLSEGIFWDFKMNSLSKDIMNTFGFSYSLIPKIQAVFSEHGRLRAEIADELGLKAGTPVTYKAGDQPNNALSLGVLNPGETAATAGTSGVIYAISDKVAYDSASRVNTFAHVNHQILAGENRLGILLCINGTGILNRWIKENIAKNLSYQQINMLADEVKIGSEGLLVMPFGNGAERVLGNKIVGASFQNLNFNVHSEKHFFRAAQEGIAFSFKYGLDLMNNMGFQPKIIKAGKANMFLSDVFTQAVVNITNSVVELYDTDGAKGAALGAGFGVNYFSSLQESVSQLTRLKVIEPEASFVEKYKEVYGIWKKALENKLTEGLA